MTPFFLMAAVEDARDARALTDLRAREASGEGRATVPIELADRIFAGEHPVRAWREHRGLTLGALARSAGIAPSYLSEIEAGKWARRAPWPRSPRPCASPSRTFWRSNAEGDLPHGLARIPTLRAA